jgi:hypothetical protein
MVGDGPPGRPSVIGAPGRFDELKVPSLPRDGRALPKNWVHIKTQSQS